ncbi:MAG: preprotein translocase subunit SecG [Bacteroidales bacterium]|nr:preprotein translocase subunit SecG [Bacteroidales bacterium]
MLTLAVILIIIVSILMILIVLAQNPKGGGLSSTFGGAGSFGGVVQTNKFLDKSTWTLAIALILFSITASMSIPRIEEDPESKIQKELMELNQNAIPDIQTPEQIERFRENEENKDNNQ